MNETPLEANTRTKAYDARTQLAGRQRTRRMTSIAERKGLTNEDERQKETARYKRSGSEE